MLTLAEEYLLLALDDEKGSFATWVDTGVAGAVLADLVEKKLVTLEGGKAQALAPSAPADPALDLMLGPIYASKKVRTATYWVQRAGIRTQIRKAIAERLVTSGVLRKESRKFLRLIPYTRFPTENHIPEHEVVERLRAIVLGGNAPDLRSVTLLALLQASETTGAFLSKSERKSKDVKARLKELTSEDALGEAAAATVRTIKLIVISMVASAGATMSSSAHGR